MELHKTIFRIAFLIYIFTLGGHSSFLYAQADNVIVNGDLENGMVNFEIYQYPVYPAGNGISISANDAISGDYSLRLPSVKGGGYKFVLPMLLLNAGDTLTLGFNIHSKKPVNVIIDGFIYKKKVFKANSRIKDRKKKFRYTMQGGIINKLDTPLSIIVWVKSKGTVTIDDISVSTTGIHAENTSVYLSPDQPLGTYGLGEIGSMSFYHPGSSKFYYRISSYIDGELIRSGEIDNGGSVELYTDKRGSYQFSIYKDKDDVEALDWRLYAVINKDNKNLRGGGRYGVAMEEYGQRQMINALLTGEDWYQLASEIGADNVRLFTAAMPDLLSDTGVSYDFTSSDEMLLLSDKYNLEPLVELGSNTPERLPEWLRSDDSEAGFNLSEGLRSKKLKTKFLKKMSHPYFDFRAYENYLETVFTHFGKRVTDYEIWNEPGHKFRTNDFIKISQLTRKSQLTYAPHARLIGFTSSKGPGAGKGADPDLLPQFTATVLAACGTCIDVLSYHSEHAFIFFGDSVDHRNEENGYVSRLKNILQHNNAEAMPIWDTERGVKWYSPHTDRIDFLGGVHMTGKGRKTLSVEEVARRLPAIHASALANGVDRLFWFYMNSGSMTSVRSHGRFGFFDSNLEPMPHLPVYDAMTEIIADAEFIRLFDRADGTRAYEFWDSKNFQSILLVYNWKQEKSHLAIDKVGEQISTLDIFGNDVDISRQDNNGMVYEINGWPVYILLENKAKEAFAYK